MAPASTFVAALPAAARAAFVGAELIATLTAHHTAGRAAYPEVAVTLERLAAELARRLGAGVTPASLARIHGAPVYLAVACSDGDPAALAALLVEITREVDGCAARMRATAAQAADVGAHCRRILCVAEPGRPAAITSYTGTGELRAYLRVIATRELVRVIHKGRREVGVAEEILDVLSPASDPELVYLRDHYRADVDAAMRAALIGLDEQARALLRFHLIDGWSIDRIGALYGIHRATAARWVTSAREALGLAIQTELAARLAISIDEVASIVRLVQSRLDVSIERLLAPI